MQTLSDPYGAIAGENWAQAMWLYAAKPSGMGDYTVCN